jgi:flagellar protein FliT
MNEEEIMFLYQAVVTLTEQMLAAARAGDWEKVVAWEPARARHVEVLRNCAPPRALPNAARESKLKMIRQILANTREMCTITQLRMANLSGMMASLGVERRVSQAYGANQSG